MQQKFVMGADGNEWAATVKAFEVALALGRQWWLLTLYGLVVTGAIVPYFRTDNEEARESIEAHTRLRKRLVPPLKWVLRIGVAGVAFFLLESILSFAQIKAATGFNDRAVARYAKSDLDGALQDCTEATRLKPGDATTINNRSVALQRGQPLGR